MFKIVKVALFLTEKLKYTDCLNFPAKRQILGLHEGLKFCQGFLCTIKKMSVSLFDPLIEKIKGVKAEEARARPLHVARSSLSNWPKNDLFSITDFFLGSLGEILECRADLIICMNCEIEVPLRYFKPESNATTEIVVRLHDRLELTTSQSTRVSLQLDTISTIGMTGLGKTTGIQQILSCSFSKMLLHCLMQGHIRIQL